MPVSPALTPGTDWHAPASDPGLPTVWVQWGRETVCEPTGPPASSPDGPSFRTPPGRPPRRHLDRVWWGGWWARRSGIRALLAGWVVVPPAGEGWGSRGVSLGSGDQCLVPLLTLGGAPIWVLHWRGAGNPKESVAWSRCPHSPPYVATRPQECLYHSVITTRQGPFNAKGGVLFSDQRKTRGSAPNTGKNENR